MLKSIFSFALFFIVIPIWSQSYEVEDIKTGLNRGKCYQTAIHVDKSTVIDNDNRKSYFGIVTNQDPQSAFEISAYPQGEQPSSSNRLTVVAFSRSGGHQEISVSYRGTNTTYYPDKIQSSQNNYGFHFELGSQDGNVVEQLLMKELIKIDVTEMTCNGTQANAPTAQYYPPPRPQIQAPPAPTNEGCVELHDALVSISSKMYEWPDEDKGKAWATSMTKKIYNLPGGCKGRDAEVNKLFSVAAKLYPKFHEDDERYSWFKSMLDTSFGRPSNYLRDRLGEEIDDLVLESNDIFDWHKEDEKRTWVTKKIRKLME